MQWVGKQIVHRWASGTAVLFIMVREFDEMIAIEQLGKEICGDSMTLEVVRAGLPIPPIEQEFLDSHPKGYEYGHTVGNYTQKAPYKNLRALATLFWEECRGSIR